MHTSHTYIHISIKNTFCAHPKPAHTHMHKFHFITHKFYTCIHRLIRKNTHKNTEPELCIRLVPTHIFGKIHAHIRLVAMQTDTPRVPSPRLSSAPTASPNRTRTSLTSQLVNASEAPAVNSPNKKMSPLLSPTKGAPQASTGSLQPLYTPRNAAATTHSMPSATALAYSHSSQRPPSAQGSKPQLDIDHSRVAAENTENRVHGQKEEFGHASSADNHSASPTSPVARKFPHLAQLGNVSLVFTSFGHTCART
jgi:hypothetical protein